MFSTKLITQSGFLLDVIGFHIRNRFELSHQRLCIYVCMYAVLFSPCPRLNSEPHTLRQQVTASILYVVTLFFVWRPFLLTLVVVVLVGNCKAWGCKLVHRSFPRPEQRAPREAFWSRCFLPPALPWTHYQFSLLPVLPRLVCHYHHTTAILHPTSLFLVTHYRLPLQYSFVLSYLCLLSSCCSYSLVRRTP